MRFCGTYKNNERPIRRLFDIFFASQDFVPQNRWNSVKFTRKSLVGFQKNRFFFTILFAKSIIGSKRLGIAPTTMHYQELSNAYLDWSWYCLALRKVDFSEPGSRFFSKTRFGQKAHEKNPTIFGVQKVFVQPLSNFLQRKQCKSFILPYRSSNRSMGLEDV